MGIGWAPTFGALDAGAAQRARMLVPAARADLDLVVTHNRTIERAATALATGEFRSAADRSADLALVGAIDPAEDVHRIIFATPQFVEAGRPLDASWARSSRPDGRLWPERLGLSFGDATFVLDDRVLARATATPGQWHETVEHLPGTLAAPGTRLDDVLAMRLAHDAGAWQGIEAADPIWRTGGRRGEPEAYPMAGVLDLPHAAAVDATRGWLLGLDRSGMITELHVRDVTPSDVRLLLVEGIGAITSRDTTLDALRGLGRERGVPVSVARSVD